MFPVYRAPYITISSNINNSFRMGRIAHNHNLSSPCGRANYLAEVREKKCHANWRLTWLGSITSPLGSLTLFPFFSDLYNGPGGKPRWSTRSARSLPGCWYSSMTYLSKAHSFELISWYILSKSTRSWLSYALTFQLSHAHCHHHRPSILVYFHDPHRWTLYVSPKQRDITLRYLLLVTTRAYWVLGNVSHVLFKCRSLLRNFLQSQFIHCNL